MSLLLGIAVALVEFNAQAKDQYVVCTSTEPNAPRIVEGVSPLFVVSEEQLVGKYGTVSYAMTESWEREHGKEGKLRHVGSSEKASVLSRFGMYAAKHRDDRFSACYLATSKERVMKWYAAVRASDTKYNFESLKHWRPGPDMYLRVEPWPAD